VTSYMNDSIGPRAVLTDLAKTLRVVARFGPLLPRLTEEQLIRLNNPPPPPRPQRRRARIAWAGLGASAVGAAWVLTALF